MTRKRKWQCPTCGSRKGYDWQPRLDGGHWLVCLHCGDEWPGELYPEEST